jgi:hypothetical protein
VLQLTLPSMDAVKLSFLWNKEAVGDTSSADDLNVARSRQGNMFAIMPY